MADRQTGTTPLAHRRLWAEFIGLYLLAPVAVAVFAPAQWMFALLFALTALGLFLLHHTPGFQWSDLARHSGGVDWRPVAGVALLTAAVSLVVILSTRPDGLFGLALQNPVLLGLVIILYPLLSALPQELVYRPLFYRRYGILLPQGRYAAIAMNAVVFSLAHLMYWNWVVLVMTFAGGVIFSWAYVMRRSFVLAVMLHAVAGWVLFTLGMGMFFYSGNVTRPF